MFGIFVALAVALAARVFALNIRRAEAFARLPAGSDRVVSDLTAVTLLAGIIGARLFDLLDHLPRLASDPAALIYEYIAAPWRFSPGIARRDLAPFAGRLHVRVRHSRHPLSEVEESEHHTDHDGREHIKICADRKTEQEYGAADRGARDATDTRHRGRTADGCCPNRRWVRVGRDGIKKHLCAVQTHAADRHCRERPRGTLN